jgi:hypothetical protein
VKITPSVKKTSKSEVGGVGPSYHVWVCGPMFWGCGPVGEAVLGRVHYFWVVSFLGGP